MSVDTDISASEDLLGKVVGDLQSNISFNGNTISGTLKYVTGYTGFSGDPAEQSGNYIALHCDTIPDADAITVELVNGTVGHPVTLDSDGIIIIRITDKDAQYVRVVATKGSIEVEKTYYLSGLELKTS